MLFIKQYDLIEENTIYIIWEDEGGRYYQSTIGAYGTGYSQYQQMVKID